MSAARRRRASCFAACVVSVMAGCSATRCSRLTPGEEAQVASWLECIDCTGGQLDSLLALASRRDPVVDTLVLRLRNGPPAVRRQVLDRLLGRAFDHDTGYANAHGLSLADLGLADSAAHVATVGARVTNGYRSRAAMALGCIHSSAALAALQNPLMNDSLSPDGRQWAKTAIDSTSDPAARARFCRSP